MNGASKLPFVCEADVAVRIDNTAVGSVLFGFGKVISYAVPQLSAGYMACASNFNALSGQVACRQAGAPRESWLPAVLLVLCPTKPCAVPPTALCV